eukprot:1161220-Pelagomonas_calceolata.AAC.12
MLGTKTEVAWDGVQIAADSAFIVMLQMLHFTLLRSVPLQQPERKFTALQRYDLVMMPGKHKFIICNPRTPGQRKGVQCFTGHVLAPRQASPLTLAYLNYKQDKSGLSFPMHLPVTMRASASGFLFASIAVVSAHNECLKGAPNSEACLFP